MSMIEASACIEEIVKKNRQRGGAMSSVCRAQRTKKLATVLLLYHQIKVLHGNCATVLQRWALMCAKHRGVHEVAEARSLVASWALY